MAINREQFISATGREPEQDDLERVNCKQAGDVGHWCCGWNVEHNRPQADIGPRSNDPKVTFDVIVPFSRG